ncbi:PREDICTED: HIG1 [Prunus dulcis]|uniref:PREDICTED: HIG1 n=4 Tax=Prunus TaxID=3754 RepID=A0A5E4EQ21_PRUDU|nr:PREDICTED: HIG1 [Prunus dulcis]
MVKKEIIKIGMFWCVWLSTLCIDTLNLSAGKDMEKVEPTLEVFYEEKKRVKNPWVPVGALLTAGVLTAGLISFRQGNSQLGQKLMRARVVAQGGTVALMVGSAYYYGENPWKKSS